MKKLLQVSVTFIVLLFAKSVYSETVLTGQDADRYVSGATQIILRDHSQVPAFILFDESRKPEFTSPDQWLNLNFQLDKKYTFELMSRTIDPLGISHYRYRQLCNGLPVEFSMWLIHVKDGKIISMNGQLTDHIKSGTQALISEQSALSNALSVVTATRYKWEESDEENYIKRISGDPNATYFPKAKTVYSYNPVLKNFNYRLAYRFDIYAHKPLARKYVFVDASDGSIIEIRDRIHESNANGTAVTGYSGTQPIITDSNNGSYRLRESNRGAGQGIETYNMLGGVNYGAAVDFTDADNYWNNVNAARDQYATDAHFAAEKTYDYFYNFYGRNSIDNAGLKLLSYVHYSTGYVNAFWDGDRMTYGDGNATYTPLTSLDIGGHEITHGLTQYTADLVYANESGALNESYSDIFGTAVEWYADPTRADWLIGEDIGSPFRSHSNPNTYGDPDTYLGTNWYTGTGDNGGVHSNSGVQNHWFYLLSVGGSGTNDLGNSFNVTGIGMSKAAAIAFRCLTVYLTPSSQYTDARTYSIQSAIDLYGSCSPEMLATVNAWYAVGVGGNATTPTTIQQDGLTTICAGDSILLTAKANLGSTYQWYRNGGLINGATSSTYYPTITGSYTVTTNFCSNISNSNAISVTVNTLTPTVSPAGTASSCTNVVLTAQNLSGYNVQWIKDGVPVNGATASTFNATQSGNYSFTLQANVTPPQSLINNSIVNIIDNSCNPAAASPITVSGLPATIPTEGISVTINVTHTWDGDIDIMLEAPNGDVLGLTHNAGGSGQNFVNTVFSDAAASALTGVAPFTGTYKPWPTTFVSCINTNKTSFSGIGNGSINPNGNWTLRIYDRYNQDVGTINNWTLSFPALSNPSPDCGPVTSAATNVSIGSDATVSVTPGSTLNYTITSKANFPNGGRSFGTAATANGKAFYGFGDNVARNDWWEYNTSTNVWTQKSTCPQAQSGGTSFAIGTKIFVVGGLNGSYLNTVYQYDESTNAWTAKTAFTGGARAYSTGASVNGKGYLIGGAGTGVTYNDIWEYNSVSDTWTLKTNFTGDGRQKMSSFVLSQKIYFGIGLVCPSSCSNSNQFFAYDPSNNTVVSKSNFPGSLRENACGFAVSSKGYIIFGNVGGTNYNDYWDYDPTLDQWTSRGTYAGQARTGSSVTVVNNKGYIFCGSIAGITTATVLEFKTISNICTNTPSSVTLQASAGSSYLWSTGATTQSITAVGTGEYNVTVTNAGCPATAYSNIAVFPVPAATISAGGPLSFCTGGSVALTASLSNSYLWSSGQTIRTITATSSDNYTVVVTGSGGCTNSSSAASVVVNPLPPITVVPDGPTTFCQGGSVTLSTYSYQAIPFAPLTGTGTTVVLADDQLTGSLPIGFSFTFFGNNYSNFNISSNGFISFGGTANGCCTGQLIPSAATPNNLISFAWNDLYPPAGGSIQYYTTGDAPNRKLVVTYTNIPHYPSGNLVTAQVILFETTNQIEIHTTAMPSDGTLHTMGIENSTGTQAVIIPGRNRANFSLVNDAVRFSTRVPTYNWSGGGGGSTLNVTTSGNYSVTVSEAGGCTTTSSVTSVIVNPLPVSNITPAGSVNVCTGETTLLTATSAVSYLWSNGATTQSINAGAGTYSVTVTSADGCTKTSATTTVNSVSCSAALNVKVLFEGFYKSGGMMEASVDPVAYPTLCDTIVVELHNSTSPYAMAFSVKGVINRNGNGTFNFPGGASGNSYYIVVKHRNALETWSSVPVAMTASTSYDFTTAASKAFGNNMVNTFDLNGWAFFSGDFSGTSGIGFPDGVIESQDYSDLENAVSTIAVGYLPEDITGDNVVESADYSILENNVSAIVFTIRP